MVLGICPRSADHDLPGRDTSILPCLGDALRCTVSPVATDLSRLLVRPCVIEEHNYRYANSTARVSLLVGNTLYAVAFGYYTVICFLGYNGTLFPAMFD